MFDWYLKVLKNYSNFRGRARRREYWYFTLANVLVVLALSVPYWLTNAFLGGNTVLEGLFTIVSFFYFLAVIVPSLALQVRRLHDTGRSGWWFFIAFVPFVGALILFIFHVLDSQPGTNKWGPNPKETAMVGASAYAGETVR